MPRHIIIGSVKLKPGSRPAAEQVADQGAAQYASFPGYERGSALFFLDEERGVYGGLTIWASKEEADAANETLMPGFEEALGEYMDGPLESTVYEIYEHKT